MTDTLTDKSKYHFAFDHMPDQPNLNDLEHMHMIFMSEDGQKTLKIPGKAIDALTLREESDLLRTHGLTQCEINAAWRWKEEKTQQALAGYALDEVA